MCTITIHLSTTTNAPSGSYEWPIHQSLPVLVELLRSFEENPYLSKGPKMEAWCMLYKNSSQLLVSCIAHQGPLQAVITYINLQRNLCLVGYQLKSAWPLLKQVRLLWIYCTKSYILRFFVLHDNSSYSFSSGRKAQAASNLR